MYRVKVEKFEGPLDLLLQLIEQNKLDITEVSLAQVTEQYLQTLHASKEHISAGILADFLVIAAKLLILKSKALLPYLMEEEDEGELELAEQLRIYRQYYEASKAISKMIAKKRFSFSRPKLFVSEELGFHPPLGVTTRRLYKIFQEILREIGPFIDLPKSIVRKTIHITEKIQRIRDVITREARISFSKLLAESKNRTEIIVSFLALLELVKQKIVAIRQDHLFQDIYIEKIER